MTHRGGDQGHRNGNGSGKPDHVAHKTAKVIIAFLTELLGNGNGKARADAVAQAQHKKVDGAGGAHTGQCVHTQKLTHHHGIHHAVQLLEQKPEGQRKHKGKHQLHGRADG